MQPSPWAWWQRRREEASPHGKRRAPFLGVTLQRNSDCKRTTRPDLRNRRTSSSVSLGISSVPTTRSMRCRKTEAWRINGTWTTVTSCVWKLLFQGERSSQPGQILVFLPSPAQRSRLVFLVTMGSSKTQQWLHEGAPKDCGAAKIQSRYVDRRESPRVRLHVWYAMLSLLPLSTSRL